MDVTSDEIRSSRFQGTRHVYDRREIDAFLHRVAATLEVYERRVAVTQAHVESLEKALDLAHSRARSVRDREIRISELETALAAAQHNYESLQAEMETKPPSAAAEQASGELAAEARRRADELVEEAAREALAIRNDAERIRAEAEEEAANLMADAEAAGADSRNMAHLEQAKMLEEVAKERSEAKAALEEEIAAKREAIIAELEEERVLLAGESAAAEAEKAADIEKAESKIAEAKSQVAEAEAAKEQLLAEIEQMREEAAAERHSFMQDAEQMVAEAVAQAELDRDRMLEEARAELTAAREAEAAAVREVEAAAVREAELAAVREAELAAVRDAELAAVANEEAAATAVVEAAEAEVAELRRQLAQTRTALSNIQARFANASELSADELQWAAALVDLDLHDVDQLVDLTSLEAETEEPVEADEEPAVVQVKSKWAGPGEIPAGSLQDGRTSEDAPPPAWRREKAPAAATSKPEPAPRPAAAPKEESLGFYERRLAGLRERLKDAAPPEA